MAETEKPHAKAGTICPFFRKDVSKVCHNCEMWEPLPVGRNAEGQLIDRHLMWGCTLKHQTFIMRDLITSIDGVHNVFAEGNNFAWKQNQENLGALIALARKIETTPALPRVDRPDIKTIEQQQ